MKEDLYLSQELWGEILGRLPLRSIVRCKCVCKSWRDLIQGKWGEVVTSYAPKPGLAFVHDQGTGYAVCDEAFQPLFRFSLPPPHDQYSSCAHTRVVIGVANGLILVWDGFDNRHINLFVLNPIAREYIELPPRPTRRCVVGFGVSKSSRQYKIFCGNLSRSCYVYTLGGGRGEGLWRSIPATTSLPNLEEGDATTPTTTCLDRAVFCNGNLHWLASDFEDKNNIFICCFDLETELFTRFSLPSGHEYESTIYGVYQLCILDGHLCFCGCRANLDDNPINLLDIIWSMKSYGDPKSWLIECTFDSPIPRHDPISDEIIFDPIFPVKVSNGDLVFFVRDQLFTYSKNVTMYGFLPHRHLCNLPNFDVYTPSFLSLKTMGIHNVQSLN